MKQTTSRPGIQAAMLAALTVVSTMALHLPAPTGYVHPGDGVALLSGLLLGPHWGFAAAGIGSALADVLLGFPIYAPATLVIKGAIAALCPLLAGVRKKAPTLPRLIFGCLAVEALMVASYYLYDSVALSMGGGAAASVPGNGLQGLFGAAIAVMLYRLFSKVPALRQRFWKG